MNILLVGLGRMGQRYLRVLNEIFTGNLRIVAIDHNTNQTFPFPVYKQLSQVPDQQFDMAIDAHPNEGRLQIIKEFVRRDIKCVISEKPIAQTWNEALSIKELVDKANIKFFTPFYNRFSKAFSQDTLKLLDGGMLQTIHISGGALGLGCNGIHYVDLCNFLFQQIPTQIFGKLDLNKIPSPRGPQFLDLGGIIFIRYPKGRATIDLSSNSSVGLNMHLIFEHGRIVILDQANPVWYWYKRNAKDFNLPIYRTSNEELVQAPFPYGNSMEEIMSIGIRNFLNGRDKPGIEEALIALKIIGFSIASSNSNLPIEFTAERHLEGLKFDFT